MTQTDLVIRPFEPSDFNFIIATWLNHYKSHSYFAKRIKHSLYFKWHNKVVQNIFNKPETSCLILHEPNEPEVIFGFFVFERRDPAIMHFVFIKEELRGMGLGTRIVEAANLSQDNIQFSHWTYPMNDIIIKYPQLNYNPYAVLL